MTIRRIFLTLSFAGTLEAQTFIQTSDPQFGMYNKNANVEHETVNFVRHTGTVASQVRGDCRR